MIWTVCTVAVPVIAAFCAGWFGREWFELRLVAKMARASDPYELEGF